MAVAAALAFLVGFYAGFFVLLSIVTLEGFQGWQFPLATLPGGGFFAGIAAALVSGRDDGRLRLLFTPLAVGIVIALVLIVFDGDFGVAIGVGGLLVVASTVYVASRPAG